MEGLQTFEKKLIGGNASLTRGSGIAGVAEGIVVGRLLVPL